MPFDNKCLEELIRRHHFFRVRVGRKHLSLEDVCEMAESLNPKFRRLLIRQRDGVNYLSMAVLPQGESKEDGDYMARGVSCYRGRYVSDIWLYYPDRRPADGQFDASNLIKRAERLAMPEDHEYLRVYNMNTHQYRIGDCVVRALSQVLNVSWEQAMERLGLEGDGNTQVNLSTHFDPILERNGFVRQGKLRTGNRLLTGKEFCEFLNRTYHHGERIFAFCGRSHVVAVVPVSDGEDRYRYKIVDTWDSTDRKIGYYWVKLDPRTVAEKETPEALLSAGAEVQHPIFGKGRVSSVKGVGRSCMAELVFEGGIRKRLAATWIMECCKVKLTCERRG